MRGVTLFTLAAALAGAALAEVRSSSSYSIEKEVLSGGGGTASSAGRNVFSSFAQPQTGKLQATLTARLGFLSGRAMAPLSPPWDLRARPGDGEVYLDWDDNDAPNLAGYNVYRSETKGGPHLNNVATLGATSEYTDIGLTNGTTYHYVVRARDEVSRESASSNEVSATPLASGILGGGCASTRAGADVFPFAVALAILAARRKRAEAL